MHLPTQQPISHLGTLPVAEFLREYWQKKHLFIKQALANFQSPIDADDLAGLAMEELASRIVIQRGDSWEVQHGPFAEDIFATLPSSHWSLLVQGVDGWIPDIHQLRHYFHFIPSWRLEDIMVSYATCGGGVGPHFDYYDVFLLQAKGRRHWKIGQQCKASEPLKPECDMKILENFHTQSEWVCEPGDLLYIPPGIAHWGTSMDDDCLTFSIGFRAPSHADILLELTQDIAADLTEDQRFSDPDLKLQNFTSEILPSTVNQIQQILQEKLSSKDVITKWFGGFVTEEKFPCVDHFINNNREKRGTLSPYVRAAFSRIDGHYAYLFINGQCWRCSILLAESLCSSTSIYLSDYELDLDQQILSELIQAHWLMIPDSYD